MAHYGSGVAEYMTRFHRKYGPDGDYTEDDYKLFAAYVDHRQACAPVRCTDETVCWVKQGPPALSPGPKCHCIGCDGVPRAKPFIRN